MNRFNGNRSFGGNRDGFRRNSSDDRPRESHKAVCADCKQDCTVPFKPAENRAVYCRECYPKHAKPRH